MTEELLNQVKIAHNICPKDKEWSGALIYKVVEGGIENIEEIKLEAVGFIMMDIGTETATSYTFEEHFFDILEEYPQLDPVSSKYDSAYRMGHIHTHHSMSAYFSKVDESELDTNCINYDFYLSLIVAYSGKFVAKIAISTTVTNITTKLVQIKGGKSATTTKEDIVTTYVDYDCNIDYGPPVIATDSFMRYIEKALRKYEKPVTRVTTTGMNDSYYKVLPYVGNLLSFGILNQGAYQVIKEMDELLTYYDLEEYQMAIVGYFDEWMKEKVPATISKEDIVNSVKRFISYHKDLWIVDPCLLEALETIENSSKDGSRRQKIEV